MKKLHTYFIIIINFLKHKFCLTYNNILIVNLMYIVDIKRFLFLADENKKNFFWKLMKKKLSNLDKVKKENQFF